MQAETMRLLCCQYIALNIKGLTHSGNKGNKNPIKLLAGIGVCVSHPYSIYIPLTALYLFYIIIYCLQ